MDVTELQRVQGSPTVAVQVPRRLGGLPPWSLYSPAGYSILSTLLWALSRGLEHKPIMIFLPVLFCAPQVAPMGVAKTKPLAKLA